MNNRKVELLGKLLDKRIFLEPDCKLMYFKGLKESRAKDFPRRGVTRNDSVKSLRKKKRCDKTRILAKNTKEKVFLSSSSV